jgi:transcriptional regulator with PAS, ATPase and Fis domain
VVSNEPIIITPSKTDKTATPIQQHEEVQETLSLEEKELEMIKKALQKYKGRRNKAAKELGISERTLYRKIIHYGIMD